MSQGEIDALKKRLTGVVQRMMGVLAADPARKDALVALAKNAQLMLGTNNFRAAAERTDELEAALAAAPPSGAPNDPAKGAVAFAKSRLAWIATSKRVAADVAKLRAALEAEYGQQGNGAQIMSVYDRRVEPVLSTFDETLADTLDAAINATDVAERARLVLQARGRIDEYKAFLDAQPLIADLDANPFVPLSIRATLGATLTALATAVR